MHAVPEDAADHGKEAGKAMRPSAQKSLEAQEDVQEERAPHLPAHGVGGVAKEVTELEGLLDLFEEDLDLPAAAVKVGDGRGGPLKVVRHKLHYRGLAVEVDPGGDPAHTIGVLASGVSLKQDDLFVG